MISCRTVTATPLLLSVLFLGLFARPSVAGSDVEASQLLQYFSSGCATQGQWTQTALSYTTALVETLKTLAEDPDCKSLNGALVQAQSLNTVLNGLTQNENIRQLSSLQQQEQQLLFFISSASDPFEISSLTSQLQSVQLQIAQYQSYDESDGSYQALKKSGDTLKTLVSGTKAILDQAAQNQTCLQKPNALGAISGIAGLAGSVAAVSMTGGQSLLAAAGADMMNQVIASAKNFRAFHRINRVASPLSRSAYQCVLETLSNQWCAGDDALRILRLQGNAVVNHTSPSPLQNGISMLNQDMPIFLGWLDSIRAGSDPGTQATATLQVTTIERDKQVRAARINGLGIIAQAKEVFDRTPSSDLQELWNIEIQTINSIVSSFNTASVFGGTMVRSVLQEVFTASPEILASWYLIGVPDVKIPRDMNGNRRALQDFSFSEIVTVVGDAGFQPSLIALRARTADWIELARAKVNIELGVILNLDPLKLIVNAATPDLNGKAAYRSLENVLQFLQAQQIPVSLTGSFKGLFDDTIKRLVSIRCEIEQVLGSAAPVSPGCTVVSPSSDPVSALANISEYAMLENGSGFLGDRIAWALRLVLNHLVLDRNGSVSDADAAALLAQNDVLAELQAYANTTDLNLMARDIQNSQVVVESTLSEFTRIFSRGLERSLIQYRKQADLLAQGSEGTSRQALAELCLKLLAAPQWPSRIPKELCLGTSLQSIFSDGPHSEEIAETSFRDDFRQRVCKFRDYNRRNWLFQNFMGRNPRSTKAQSKE